MGVGVLSLGGVGIEGELTPPCSSFTLQSAAHGHDLLRCLERLPLFATIRAQKSPSRPANL
jgi:hypothetical protein